MYNYLGEIISLFISLVFIFFILKSYYLKDKRNLLFFFCNVAIIFSCGLDILSCLMIENAYAFSHTTCTIVTTAFFISLSIVPFLCCLYCYASINSTKITTSVFHAVLYSLFGSFLIIILSNPKTEWLFSFDQDMNYVRGPFAQLTYVLVAGYILLMEITVIIHRKHIVPKIFSVFVIYPVVCSLTLIIQFFNPYWITSGASGAITLIILYVAIQSDKIEIDFRTGLRTSTHLWRVLSRRKRQYTLSLFSIENYVYLREKIGSTELERIVYQMTAFLRSYINGEIYSDGSRFYVISPLGINNRGLLIHAMKKFREVQSGSGVFTIDYLAASVDVPSDAKDHDEAAKLLDIIIAKGREQNTAQFLTCTDEIKYEYQRTKTILQILDRELNVGSKQYMVYFQPIMSLKQNKFLYAESLSRLNNTELGDISPAEFIPIAEKYGLIEKLGRLNFEKVCDFISKNKEVVKAVSVNFSVYQMTSPDIEDFVLGTVAKYDILPENIIIEITESIVIEDMDLIRQKMDFLSQKGFVFYLDDFGTGFSNFANVIKLPFSTIKIDRSFVLEMEKDGSMAKLVRNLISTFKDSNLKILVEGVENPVQDQLVKNAGADFIQGFHYSRPLPMDKYLELLKAQ